MIVGDSFTTASAAQSTSIAESNGLASDFDTFLQLLTAQIRHQDPLNPADSTEFVAQLATFSNVEQTVQTNDLLKDMSTQLGLQNMGQMASWVGMEARAVMPVAFDGTPEPLLLSIPTIADKAELVVTNAAGEEVQRLSVDPETIDYAWPGKTAGGAPLPHGVYSFHIESTSGDQALSPTPVETFGVIEEATSINGQVILMFDGNIGLPTEGVLGIRPANAGATAEQTVTIPLTGGYTKPNG